MTFNVAAIPVVHGRVPARMTRIADLIRQKGYDIAAFQECWSAESAHTLGSQFESKVRYADGILGGDGLLLASHYPVVDQRNFTYSVNAPLHRFLYGEADGIAAKGVIAATFQTPVGRLKVFNTHFIAGYRDRDYVVERVAQVYEISAFIRGYAGGDPFVLLGDLNFTPASPEYAMLTGLLGLRDACAGCAGSDVDKPGRRIDHVFLSSGMAGWTVARSSVSFHESLDAKGRIRLSDHYAVEIVLRSPVKGAAPARPAKPLLSREQALLAVIRDLEKFMNDTDRSILLNIVVPFYGWSHARWGTRQIRAAGRIQSEALAELQRLTGSRRKLVKR